MINTKTGETRLTESLAAAKEKTLNRQWAKGPELANKEIRRAISDIGKYHILLPDISTNTTTTANDLEPLQH